MKSPYKTFYYYFKLFEHKLCQRDYIINKYNSIDELKTHLYMQSVKTRIKDINIYIYTLQVTKSNKKRTFRYLSGKPAVNVSNNDGRLASKSQSNQLYNHNLAFCCFLSRWIIHGRLHKCLMNNSSIHPPSVLYILSNTSNPLWRQFWQVPQLWRVGHLTPLITNWSAQLNLYT